MTRFTRLLRPVLGLWLILCAVPVMAQTFPKFIGVVGAVPTQTPCLGLPPGQ